MTPPTEQPPENVPVDPYGPDPEGIPDPMPEDLQVDEEEEEAYEEADPMEGPAPTG